ncbi:hypothetical protein C1H46_034651 [Malus baccata]|uniref:AB hydrolase-1 domain-containing protein n=1 Tax=Malus baccata TaxID=106549 RepID=A0A540KZZ3_MALBA|nr:hypothetical protein C1H46_034651 [Malus baccata]
MVTITEENEGQHRRDPKPKPKPKPKRSSPEEIKPTPPPKRTSPPPKPPQNSQNPFAFWFYFTLTVSLVTVVFISLSSLSPQDPKSWFLSLPAALRQHYSKGRTIKVQTHPNQNPVEVFCTEKGSVGSENVVIVHGLGLSSYSFRKVVKFLGSKGVRAVAFDLPGNGFSDKSVVEVGEGETGILGRFWNVYGEIQEKGLFWAFDRIIETGQMPYEEIEARVSKQKVVKPIEMGPEEIGKVLGQVIETTGLAPVHLIDVDAHRLLLKGRDGTRAVVGMGKKLNHSFDIAEWGGSDGLKGVPMQVLWSSSWSKEWSEEGNRVASALPQATFVTHSGGRWPQEDAADEVAENISYFVSSLPATVRKVEEEPIPEHIQKMLDEAKSSDHHHHDHGDGHDHHHSHGASYPDAYGLGHSHGLAS